MRTVPQVDKGAQRVRLTQSEMFHSVLAPILGSSLYKITQPQFAAMNHE